MFFGCSSLLLQLLAHHIFIGKFYRLGSSLTNHLASSVSASLDDGQQTQCEVRWSSLAKGCYWIISRSSSTTIRFVGNQGPDLYRVNGSAYCDFNFVAFTQ